MENLSNNDKFKLFIRTVYEKHTSKYIKFRKINNKYFVILLPPPNVTGFLHLGHVLNLFMQDTIYRIYESLNYNVIWNFGCDHAGIATENKVLNILKSLNIKVNNSDLLNVINNWSEYSKNNILSQIKLLNLKLNIKKQYFTMDTYFQKEIQKYIKLLLKKKLIYISRSMVNYCFYCKTTLSDEENIKKIEKKKLYYIKYFLKNDPTKFVLIATTKPSTLIGDIAVVYNTNLSYFKNQLVKVPLINRYIPLLSDKNDIIKQYGSGFLKISPFFDKKDFQFAKKHKLKIKNIIDINNNNKIIVDDFKNCSFNKDFDEKIINLLNKNNLIDKVEEKIGLVFRCYRCTNKTNTILSLQFFLDINKVANYKFYNFLNQHINFIPKKTFNSLNLFTKLLKPWCISRQIKWGHPLSIKLCLKCKFLNFITNKKCKSCNFTKFKFFNYTLDTWFSSSLYHLIVSKKNIDLIITGKDILFFWIFKMLIMSFIFKKRLIKNIFLHGVIRDKDNKKMSKSLCNSPDIQNLLLKYNSDILRMNFFWNCGSLCDDFKFILDNIKFIEKIVNKFFSINNLLINKSSIKIRMKKNMVYNKKNIIFFIYFFKKLFNLYILRNNCKDNNFNISYIFKSLYNFIKKEFSAIYLEIFKIYKFDKKFVFFIWKMYLIIASPFHPFYSNLFLKKYNIDVGKFTKNIIQIKKKCRDLTSFEYKKLSILRFLINFLIRIKKIRSDIAFFIQKSFINDDIKRFCGFYKFVILDKHLDFQKQYKFINNFFIIFFKNINIYEKFQFIYIKYIREMKKELSMLVKIVINRKIIQKRYIILEERIKFLKIILNFFDK